MADSKRWPDNSPFSVGDYRISWNGDYWQAVKNGIVQYKHVQRKQVYDWARKH
jgi:hypothetical protein